jgi:lysozyme
MEFSAAGLELLKKCEGFRARTYMDACGFPTIGYGHRLLYLGSYADGIDEPHAALVLACDVRDAENDVRRMVKVPLTQGQFDALVDFVFNMGTGRLAGSTLLKDLNAKQYDAAAEQLKLWDHGLVDGKEAELPGLKARRLAEFDLWHGGAA